MRGSADADQRDEYVARAWARALQGTPSGEHSAPMPRRPDPRLGRQGVPCSGVNDGWAAMVHGGLRLAEVVMSPIVPDKVCNGRDRACDACDNATVYDGVPYCQCCGCGRWSGIGESSDCYAKNRHAMWSCPKPSPEFGQYGGETVGGGARWWQVPAMWMMALLARMR